MKNLFVFCLIVFAFSNGFSQTINDVPLKNIDVDYMQIVGTAKVMSNKVTIEVDFGQENKYWSQKDTQVKDENGKKMEFNSMIDALNFFSKNGYDFVNAYAITIGNSQVYHYLLKRKK